MTEETARSPRLEATPLEVPHPPAAAPGAPSPAHPPWPEAGPHSAPPPAGYAHTGFTSRYGLVRPWEGRYLAGVCAAIGRATNTDPVLWRVLLAVLGFFGGVGIFVYVSAWLIVPGEGDSASPVESMLGRGRSSMSPVTVIVLSVLVAVSFGFIVTDAFRAVLLGASILIGGALLLNRDHGPPEHAGSPAAPLPEQLPPHTWPGGQTPDGYRQPFAPHGPYGTGPTLPVAPPAAPGARPKRPRDRSPLGVVTFSLVFLACGVIALLHLLGVVQVGASAYFAAALATIGLGLLVGTWFGRARWLIALGVVTAAALGFATAAESFDHWRTVNGSITWTPVGYQDLAARYENAFGTAVLDLRGVDFDQQDVRTTVVITLGEAQVLLPPNVDVTTVGKVRGGEAVVFGVSSSGFSPTVPETTNLGADGVGGGRLRLVLEVYSGVLEVKR